jgi:hypothetical protein
MACIVFLDLKKAFDVCSHSILLAKLSKMGIQDTAWNGLIIIYQADHRKSILMVPYLTRSILTSL